MPVQEFTTRRERLDALKLEIDMIRSGRYNPPAGHPREFPVLIRDSITCPNVMLPDDRRIVSCDDCFLHPYMPINHNSTLACHDIELNEHGDTLAKLQEQNDPEKMKTVLLAWLEKTVSELEKS